MIEQLRAAETREEQRRIRDAALRTKREREKALRAERHDFAIGAQVTVNEQPSLAGMTGVITSSDGRSAVVAFGGSLVMSIEAWRLSPHDVSSASIAARSAPGEDDLEFVLMRTPFPREQALGRLSCGMATIRSIDRSVEFS